MSINAIQSGSTVVLNNAPDPIAPHSARSTTYPQQFAGCFRSSLSRAVWATLRT